jgi:peptidoglycan/LPS O-acetylase OafA/YrhL
MVRGLAALLVLIGHLRAFVFHSYDKLTNPGPLDTAFWIVTGVGHQAVMIFFVLSGFFITRSIVIDTRRRRFSWFEYPIKRLTRLWTVLIPCLILTFFWDSLGISLSHSAFYDGQLNAIYHSGPISGGGGADLTLSTFIKNVLFLQTIVAPTFGSNGPLWSLANEFWYYLMFPLLYISIARPRNWFAGAINFSLFIGACALVGQSVALYGLIWLAGAASYLVYDRGWLAASFRTSFALGAAVVALFAALAISKTHYSTDFAKDCLVGLAATILVLVLSHCESGGHALYRQFARTLADASYTIYLAHFPFLAVLASVVLGNHQFPNSAVGYAVFAGLGAAGLVYCYGVYWLFERHTAEIRRYCLTKFGRARGAVFGVG